MPNHDHTLNQKPHKHNWGNTARGFLLGTGNVGAFAQGGTDPSALFTQDAFIDLTMGLRGGGQAHNNVQPSKAITVYMKL